MKIHNLTRAPHLAAHVDAVWKHLPDALRGERICDHHARAPKHWAADDLVMVGSFTEVNCVRNQRIIYVEHGAGQSYLGLNEMGAAYYHGGEHPASVIGYIGPRQDVIDAWGRPGYATGSPVCDPYQLFTQSNIAVITFHYNPPVSRWAPEAGTAFDHWEPHLKQVIQALQGAGYTVWGHRHPRFNHLRGYWDRVHGIYEATIDEVRTNASLLIADNTSVIYEMMYLMRDVIALNAPWYRRDVEHGLRFWEHAPPVQADDLEQLLDQIETCVSGGGTDWTPRICQYVYGKAHADGADGLRAATWLTMLAHDL